MISIIVPIYNVKDFLVQCIESLICQTYTEIEIILVDDGSTDGSSIICDEYADKDSRITVIHKANGGLVSARKAGLRVAQGQYIAYVDGDDWVEVNMYGRMHQKMEEVAVDVVMCGRYEDTGNIGKAVFYNIPEGRYGKRELMYLIYPQMIATDDFYEYGVFPGMWDKLFRRKCIEEFVFAVDERINIAEDAACIYPCFLNVDSIFVMRECLYHYRQTPFSMIKEIPDQKEECKRFRILYRTVNESLKKYAHIYDLRQQWNRFMLFLMIPRADGLYQGYGALEYLFPFPNVKKGSRIVLYCAGTYGQRLYQYLQRTGFCQVVAWVDRNYRQLQDMRLPVENPDVLQERDYDAIVIANMFAGSRKALYNDLASRYPREKIHMLDEALIFSSETKCAFGLQGLMVELEKNLEKYDRIFLFMGKDEAYKEFIARFCASRAFSYSEKKVLILTTEELPGNKEYVCRRVTWEEAERLKEFYLMYEFSDKFKILSREGSFGSIINYVETGVLPCEAAFEAILQ